VDSSLVIFSKRLSQAQVAANLLQVQSALGYNVVFTLVNIKIQLQT